ncbi:oligosaccharide flippase family protein [Pedobacter sp. HMF7647]|uniref:Oligosaccharide flippase family protein n=1 Tax=Hufsiella arboris TaxID=2695275 RepID=A0A7K1YAU7_9SPHI|nr:oligosaccharide flippase family protein [Hufsiella arboris]MXV51704.1 oligosaccharide flippase family protein [Hufsiella arboris]
MYFRIKRLSARIGIDGAIAFTIATRVIQALGGVISIIFITKFLTGVEQGYYYTFASIIAVQIFFELGLCGIITQYVAHECAYLNWDDDYVISGDKYNLSRLSSLLHFCVKWFGIISIILFFVLIVTGLKFFSFYGKESASINWQLPWISLCLTTSLNLFIDPILAFFEGLGFVKDIAKLRLVQKCAFLSLVFIFYILDFKLYSAALASLFSILVNLLQILLSKRIKILKLIWKSGDQWKVDYIKEIFPYQWKIAISWISGYFIFQLFNPVLFATAGAIAAGQMGMTLAALNGVLSVSISWITTKIPLFSSLVAKKDYTQLDEKFNLILKQACVMCAICLAIFILFVLITKGYNFPVANRFLPLLPLALMSISTFVSQLIFGLAVYLRCHKQEPLVIQSVVTGILTTISTLVFGKVFGVNGLTIGYTSIMIFVSLTWCVYIFNKKKQEWHQS